MAATAYANDSEILEGIKRSDSKAFKQFYYAYYERLGQYIFNRIHSNEQTQDLLQDIFAWIWNHRKTLNIQTSLSAYVYRMAHNMTINLYAKRSREKAYYLSKKQTDSFSETDPVELRMDIHRAVASLPESIHEVFVLSRYEGKKNAEIAEILNLSIKTVESRMTKALKTLRSYLGDG